MAKEVRIELTAAQKAKIKAATGKDMSEIRVSRVGSNPAVSSSKNVSARVLRAAALRLNTTKAINTKALRLNTTKAINTKALKDTAFRSGAENT